MERDPKLELKVGIFVVMGISILAATFIVLGSEQNLFERNYRLHARFTDISGLRAGAAVRLSGMDVGIVQGIEFPEDLDARQVVVHMRIAERFQERIRGDSVASIQSQGLLGDKFVSVSLGAADRPLLEDGSWVDATDPKELMSYLDDVGPILANIKSITHQIDVLLKGEDGERAGKSIADMLASIKRTIVEIETGDGIAHKLIYDKEAGANLASTLASLKEATASIAGVVEEVRSGDGGLHDLVYGDKVTRLLASLEGAAGKIDGLVGEIQTGSGVLHDLVYSDGGKSLLANLTDTSADIKDVIAGVKRGEGTLGGLLVDPTIYQDVKSLLGKAQRNQVLKAFVRENLRRNEDAHGVTGPVLQEP